jgi:exodeoxyribonuclease-5
MTDKVLETFIAFLRDSEAADMYITGIAGTGKTTSLAELLEYCVDNKIKAITVAYTHKACGILRTKLPAEADVATLHSFLKKRPTINDNATKLAHVDGNSNAGKIDALDVIFIDEFSMVGEKDFLDLSELQYNEEGEVLTKIVYIGDPNQLPPVKDAKAITPSGRYNAKLTQIRRQADGNKLIDTLQAINGFINGEKPKALEEHNSFKRNTDIVKLYKQDNSNKVMLAYTNAQVEYLNSEVQGREKPIAGDLLFTPTTRKFYTLEAVNNKAPCVITINGSLLELNSKYGNLEKIHKLEGVSFYTLVNEMENLTIAAVFGHAKYLEVQQTLANKAVLINKKITKQFNCDAREWVQSNGRHELAKERAEAWSNYLSFKGNVFCLDFAHAMTVHKSQGSTYENVYLDTEDMAQCADKDYDMYLKLMYVAISRASHKVFTN